jgi:hypothetical protein
MIIFLSAISASTLLLIAAPFITVISPWLLYKVLN